MKVSDYELVNPNGSEAGEELRRFGYAHPFALERLLQALELFALSDTDYCCKVTERGAIEIFLVPHRQLLAHIPDVAALIEVNHDTLRITIIEVIEEYGGYDEAAQWERLRRI
jgi:hypothetical protein